MALGFPAHAGMDPRIDLDHAATIGFPAHAGMDPRTGHAVSPPTLAARGFPAHAGMDPTGFR